MKHAVLYTCIGLMGTAAIAGYSDYSRASKAGLLKDLYKEETPVTGSMPLTTKKVDMEDYSRAALEEAAQRAAKDELAVNAPPEQPKKKKKRVPPPPPPPPPSAPPPPPKPVVSVEGDVPPVPPANEMGEITVPPASPGVADIKEVTWENFSRAPLKHQKHVAKRNKRSNKVPS